MKLSTTMMINEKLLPTGKRAFTLAEVLITLSILGVVAAMTIPTLVNRQSDIAAQTRLKKAISNYHDLVEIYMLENGTSDAGGMMGNSCANAEQYFKITSKESGNACAFTTADGARWEFTPATGNAVVTDSATGTPRYAVVLWNAAGFVNSDQCNDDNDANNTSCGTYTTVPTYTGTAPVNGYFNAKEFIASTGAQLKAKGTRTNANAATGITTATNVDTNAATSGAAGTGTGLARKISK